MKLQRYEEYSSITSKIYQDLKSRLSKLIPSARIDHIGSSAIPNSLSECDLDVLIAVNNEEFNTSLEIIKTIGFKEKQNTLRTNDLCMLITDEYNYDVAIQLIVKGSEFENFIIFRDALLADSGLVKKYNDLKAKYKNQSEEEYRAEKSKFIKSVLSS